MNNDDLEILVEEVLKKETADKTDAKLAEAGYDLEAVKKIISNAMDEIKAAGISMKPTQYGLDGAENGRDPLFQISADDVVWNRLEGRYKRKEWPSYRFDFAALFAKEIPVSNETTGKAFPDTNWNVSPNVIKGIRFSIIVGGLENLEYRAVSTVKWYMCANSDCTFDSGMFGDSEHVGIFGIGVDDLREKKNPMDVVSKMAKGMVETVVKVKTASTNDVANAQENGEAKDSNLKYNNETGMFEPKE